MRRPDRLPPGETANGATPATPAAGGAAAHGRILRSAFVPHPLMRNPHVQTILPALLRPVRFLPWRIEKLELPDGDFIELGWAGSGRTDAPVAVLLHGLGGSLESKYVCGLGRRLGAAGWSVCAVRQRGAGPQPNRLPRAYNHGDSEPIRFLWQTLRQRAPDCFIACVGWSLGGNVMLKALGEAGVHAPIDQAYALSVPFRLHECAEHLRHGFARVYQRRLLDACKDMVRRKHAARPLPSDVDLVMALDARDFFEFDGAFTAPTSGYRDAEDYYARAACGSFLTHIRRPTRILHALDDPFMRPEIVPAAAALSPWVDLELSERGGHVGFLCADAWGRPQCWSEAEVCRRLQADHAAARGRIS